MSAPAVGRILDLYAQIFDGSPLGEDEYVISSDEKTAIQARCRCHPTAGIERHEQKERDQQHEHDHQPAALAAA